MCHMTGSVHLGLNSHPTAASVISRRPIYQYTVDMIGAAYPEVLPVASSVHMYKLICQLSRRC